MSIHVTTSILKSFGPGLRVRDEHGNAKTVKFDVERVCIPSASIKYMMRRDIGGDEIRTAYMGLFIRNYLKNRVKSNSLSETDFKLCNEVICSVVGCNPVTEDNPKPKDNDKDEKGNTVLVFETNTLHEILATLVPYIIGNKVKTTKTLMADALAEATLIYNRSPRAKCEALFGAMSTAGVTKTMYGSVHMSHMYSIDRYAGDNNFWIATHHSNPNKKSLRAFTTDASDTDDFFNALVDFNKHETTKPNADSMGDHDLYANTMYGNMTIDIRTLFENLNIHNEDKSLCTAETTADLSVEAIKSYLLANPGAKQTSFASHPVPELAYIEVVKNGAPTTYEFNRQVVAGNTSVIDQGISQLLDFAKDTTFRTGEIKRYALLPEKHENYRKLFEDAGITVLRSLSELESVLHADVTDLVNSELL